MNTPLSTTTVLTPLWPDPLPAGKLKSAYSYTLTASGGTPPYTFAVATGALPPGLTLNASTGAITGTPTVIETLEAVTFSVTDSGVTMTNPTKVTWTEPTNADGTPITSTEITGYNVGYRASTGVAGTYPTIVAVSGASTLTSLIPTLGAGSWMVAFQAVGAVNTPWSPEAAFTLVEIPQAPTVAPVVS